MIDAAFEDLLPGAGRFTRTARSLSLDVDAASWPTDALYASAFTFVDRCYVLLETPAEGRACMHLTTKAGALDEGAARALAEELAEELCGHAWRSRVMEQNKLIVEAITVDAYDGSADALFNVLASDPGGGLAFDDPLGISLSWEEKFGDKKRAAAAPGPGPKPSDPIGEGGG